MFLLLLLIANVVNVAVVVVFVVAVVHVGFSIVTILMSLSFSVVLNFYYSCQSLILLRSASHNDQRCM